MVETLSVLGADISLYYLFWILGLIAAIVTGCLLRKDYDFSFAQAMTYVAWDIVFAYLLIWGVSWIFGGGKTIGFNFARIAAVAPIYFVLMAKMFKVPLWKMADFLAPPGAIILGISHLGCIFSGCCHGYPSDWGIYSNVAQTVCFPIQPIESMTNILIGIVLFVMAKHEIQQGRLYVWFMILFGSTRFVFEFLRDNEKVWFGLSDLALHALAALILGTAALIYLKQRRQVSVSPTGSPK